MLVLVILKWVAHEMREFANKEESLIKWHHWHSSGSGTRQMGPCNDFQLHSQEEPPLF